MQNNRLLEKIDITDKKAEYDENVKWLLSIDLEAQKKYYPGYNIITRGIFYCARMISAQMGTQFTGDDYDKIKKVYSIWICTDCPKYAENTITEYSVGQNNIVGDFPSDKGRYDLLSVVMVCLSKELAQGKASTRLHRLLGTLLSPEMTRQEKKDIMKVNMAFR